MIGPGELRIIPARAGFTRRPCCSGVDCRDHPRSRGVYVTQYVVAYRCIGSSPLARGLRPARLHRGAPDRIIPARAGFTLSGRPDDPRSADHPRSRGVYLVLAPDRGGILGSSPLARGLPLTRAPGTGQWRIIPARAGFTTTVEDDCRAWSDHPRSRGVYVVTTGDMTPSSGSSPLARGLHGGSRSVAATAGIIPARAGFTCPLKPLLTTRPDHPRSRGVYLLLEDDVLSDSGSSPLARGLRVDVAHVGGVVGIIPARAGFTTQTNLLRPCSPDHPRSRGVYRQKARRAARAHGSSPLARGLHAPTVGGGKIAGIIPARAGFTYQNVHLVAADLGSSPLARGLPGHHRGRDGPGGIIPARAGFTSVPYHWGRGIPDHPRSRGVYAPCTS